MNRHSPQQLLSSAKVLMVADVVEAMTSNRPHRPALGSDMALAEIERGAGTLYDAEVCQACTTVVRERGFTFSEIRAGETSQPLNATLMRDSEMKQETRHPSFLRYRVCLWWWAMVDALRTA